MIYKGKWYGKKCYFGLHYDLHANKKDTSIGMHCGSKELIASLKLMNPDFVQTDCKGHPGMTSWFSRIPTATVSPGVKKDAMKGWREATRKMGLPLNCHYSGIWDKAAAEKYPDWAVIPNPTVKTKDGKPVKSEKMCPRGPYLEKLMIPQMIELIDRYKVDGFWVDGELWAVDTCYCTRCRSAFQKATGIKKPPYKTTDKDWVAWANFHKQGFDEYVTRYCNAVHAHKPGVLVCSNWLQTFKDPGEPKVPTDWISGDNMKSLDNLRCESRFTSTRGKPWDFMTWNFYKAWDVEDQTSGWSAKPVQMMKQEAAMILALGGNFQVYENPPGLRDGRLASWRMKNMGQVGRFVKIRRTVCQDTETIPQIAVLHSEFHYRTQPVKNLFWDYDVLSAHGAVFSLLENSFGVDIMDEWALLPRLREFPVVVVPEQDKMSDHAVQKLKQYAMDGGCLFLTGSGMYERFGSDFLGAKSIRVEDNAYFHVPFTDNSFGMYSKTWRLLQTTTAKPFSLLSKTILTDSEFLPYPAATVNKTKKGTVIYMPCDLFRFFSINRYPLTRRLIGEIVKKLIPKREIAVQAPVCVDIVLRRKTDRKIVHLINRASGLPAQPQNGAVDEIPGVGPVNIVLKVPKPPKKVILAFENEPYKWKYVSSGKNKGGIVKVVISRVQIHSTLIVE